MIYTIVRVKIFLRSCRYSLDVILNKRKDKRGLVERIKLLKDENYKYWGLTTEEFLKKYKGSHCGLCGKWIKGDPGDPSWPPDWRWTACDKCLKGGKKDA